MEWKPSSKYSGFNYLSEVSDCLKWAQDRAAALGVAGLALAHWFWLDFIFQYHVPVGLFSPALLAALPALLFSIIFFVLIFAAALLMPSVTLLAAFDDEGTTLIDLRGSVVSSPVGHGKKVDAWRRWMVATGVQAAIWALMLSAVVALGIEVSALLTLLVLALVIAVSVRILINRLHVKWTMDLLVAMVPGLFLQSVISLEFMSLALHFVKGDQLVTYLFAAAYFLVAMILLVVGQSIVAGVIRKKGLYRGIFSHMVIVSGSAVALLAIFVPVGGELASMPIRFASSGARGCVVLGLSPLGISEGDTNSDLLDEKNKAVTKPLIFALLVDGIYYVALKVDGKSGSPSDDVYKLKQEAVGRIESCPR